MKTLVLVLVLSLTGISVADAQDPNAEFYRRSDDAKTLAVKLYPDTTQANSPLVKMMIAMDRVLKTKGSRLYDMPTKPLIEATEAAAILKIDPHWESLNEDERKLAYAMLTMGLLSTQDLTLPVPVQTAAQAPQPAPQQPFNPGSINDDVNARKAPPAAVRTDSGLRPTRNGYLYFYNDLVNKSGGLTGHQGGRPPTYVRGPLAGKSEGEGKAYAQEQWQSLTSDQQLACEQNAQTYGPGPDPDVPNPNQSHVYTFQPNGAGGGVISGN